MLAKQDVAREPVAGGPRPRMSGALVEGANEADGADNISVELTREPGAPS